MVTRAPRSPVLDSSGDLDVRLLGGFQVLVGGRPLDALRSGRARSLLAFLVLHADVAHARQRLAFEFWPDSSEAQARTNLRNVLHTLRRAHPALEAALRVSDTTLQWRPAKPVGVDVDRFAAAVEAAVSADPDDPDGLIARCRAALAVYGGDLLAGDHDEWVAQRREALHEKYRDVLRRLATALIDAGRPGEATAVARELVRAGPVDEAAHRLRIEAHHAAGDRAGAVRAYHECVATLERELGVGPASATAQIYAAVLGTAADAATPRRPAVRARPGLVGREREWRRLVGAWEAVEHGPPSAVLVTGEAGIGKTRLVDELQAWCAGSGAAVGLARSYATEGDLGYGVVASWLRSLGIEREIGLGADQRGELSRLLPELGAPPAAPGDDADRRRRLFEAASVALTGTGVPTLLVADDFQWSDQVSQEFIHYLIRRSVDVPLLVVLTARREELDLGHHPISGLRDSLIVLDRLTEVVLDRLSREATGALATQLTGSPLDETAIESLFSETEGNPLFVVEVVRAGTSGIDGAGGGLSPRLRALIDARFRRLSEIASAVLGAAAVVRRPSSAKLLSTVSGLDDRSLARGLDELWHRGILRETGVDAYEFSHGKLREAAYENLSPAMRRSYHGTIAEAFAAGTAHEPGVASSEVALHFEAANRPDDAVAWLHRAAVDALDVAAYAEAVRLLDRAVALVPSLAGDARHARELELLSTMPLALGGAEGYGTDRMHEAHRRVTDVAANLGVDLKPAVLRSMVMSALCRDEFEAAADAAGRLHAHAGEVGDAALELESEYLLGISAFWAGRLGEARSHFEAVVAGFGGATRRRHHEVFGHDPQVVCLSRLANTLWFLGRPEEARATCEEALALADFVGHPLSHDTAAVFSCLLAIDLGDYDMLRQVARRLDAVGIETIPFVTKRDAVLGLLEVIGGAHGGGIAKARAALDRCGERNFYPGFRAAIARILLAAHGVAQDDAGGLETCERALALGGTPLWHPEIHRARAAFLHVRGAPANEVDTDLQKAEALARRFGADGHLPGIDQTRRQVRGQASPAST